MNLDDPPARTRRELRARASGSSDAGAGNDSMESLLTPTRAGDSAAVVEPTEPVAMPVDTAPEAEKLNTLEMLLKLDPQPEIVRPAPPEQQSASFGPGVRRGGAAAQPTAAKAPATAGRTRVALSWVDEAQVTRSTGPTADLTAATTPYVTVGTDLLADAPRRSPLRAGVVVPTLITVGLVGVYAATTLLWPLHAVAPTVSAIQVQPVAAPATTPAWPAAGSAAVSVAGMSGVAASTPDPHAIASITKLVTALVVLDDMPLAPGEQGPEFRFSSADSSAYWGYRNRGESALQVPVGGKLTEYELLEGMLVGSANNYADRLAGNLWPSDAVFANAANAWLAAHGVPGVTVVEPTGMDPDNVASPEALIPLAQKALANPVIAEIVAKQSVDLPGAGHVVSTNGLLADPGVVGLKTGTLVGYNLLSAKDVTIGDKTVRMFASVLGSPDDASRLEASRALYTQLEAELQPRPSVTAGTTAGIVETAWGDSADIVTSGDASVILWNGGSGTVSTTYSLGDSRAKGDVVGSLSVDGPLDDTTVELRLAGDIEDPSPWWRLTHPLELFGLTD